jgi:anhydro-N-acetylmuramic acid kinase
MSKSKIYTVMGIMSGTSMDGLDISLLETNGIDFSKILIEKSIKYSSSYKKKLKTLIKKLPNNKLDQINHIIKNENFITELIIINIKKFLKEKKIKKEIIYLIGFSGQTIIHNPQKKYTLQAGSGWKINKALDIPVISNFREKDMQNGGQGAPIGSFYHKHIIQKIKKKLAIINIGGISNITFLDKKNVVSFDIGPGNAVIDDLTKFFYNKNYDHKGLYARDGKLIKKIYEKFKKDKYFRIKNTKSLDREYFHDYFKLLQKYKKNDAIHTSTLMTVNSIVEKLKILKSKFNLVLVSGGGRKNIFIIESILRKMSKISIKIEKIDNYKYNGDFVEAQMFGYIAVRSVKKLAISSPTSTGVRKTISGGVLYGKLIKS